MSRAHSRHLHLIREIAVGVVDHPYFIARAPQPGHQTSGPESCHSDSELAAHLSLLPLCPNASVFNLSNRHNRVITHNYHEAKRRRRIAARSSAKVEDGSIVTRRFTTLVADLLLLLAVTAGRLAVFFADFFSGLRLAICDPPLFVIIIRNLLARHSSMTSAHEGEGKGRKRKVEVMRKASLST
jgi:hypothetical protein